MKNNILFLLSHQPNPRFVKQIKYLSSDSDVSVVYYYRDYMKDLSNEYKDSCVLNQNIGTVSNGNYFQRVVKYLKSIKKLYTILNKTKYDTLIINNIDTLALNKKIVHISNGGELYDLLEEKEQFVSEYNLDNMKKVLLNLKKDFLSEENEAVTTFKEFDLKDITKKLEKYFV